MPSSIMHLKLADSIDLVPSASLKGMYLLGSISPDSIHMRTGATREDKRNIHLFAKSETLEERFQKIYLFDKAHTGYQNMSFIKGWILHLMTDSLWSYFYVHGFWDKCERGITTTERERVYYQESETIEAYLSQVNSWRCNVWELLSNSCGLSFPPYLSSGEIEQWKSRVLSDVARYVETRTKTTKYMTSARVEAFLSVTENVCRYGLKNGIDRAAHFVERHYPKCFLTDVT
jgi:hypothetical protein